MRLVRMIWYDLAKACDACYATEQNLVDKQKPPVVLPEGALERRLVGLGL